MQALSDVGLGARNQHNKWNLSIFRRQGGGAHLSPPPAFFSITRGTFSSMIETHFVATLLSLIPATLSTILHSFFSKNFLSLTTFLTLFTVHVYTFTTSYACSVVTKDDSRGKFLTFIFTWSFIAAVFDAARYLNLMHDMRGADGGGEAPARRRAKQKKHKYTKTESRSCRYFATAKLTEFVLFCAPLVALFAVRLA